MAAVGVSAMVAGSFDAGALAVALPIVMTFSFAIVIVLTRYRRDVSMMPATCASQALVVVVVAPFASLGSATRSDWGIFFALGVFQIGARPRAPDDRRAPAPAGRGRAALTARGRARPALGLARLLGAADTATLVGGAVVTAAIVVQATASDDAPAAVPERARVPAPESG